MEDLLLLLLLPAVKFEGRCIEGVFEVVIKVLDLVAAEAEAAGSILATIDRAAVTKLFFGTAFDLFLLIILFGELRRCKNGLFCTVEAVEAATGATEGASSNSGSSNWKFREVEVVEREVGMGMSS